MTPPVTATSLVLRLALAVAAVVRWARGAFVACRNRGRISLTLSWDRLRLSIPGRPTPRWRAVDMRVTAPKSAEFVIDSGRLQMRVPKKLRWSECGALSHLVQLPIVVPANRTINMTLPGRQIAKIIETCDPTAHSVEIRVFAADHYGREIESDLLAVGVADLRTEEHT